MKALKGRLAGLDIVDGAYTKDEAEKWIAEYEKSTGYQSATDESKSAAARRRSEMPE